MSLQYKFCCLREGHGGSQGQASLPKLTLTESPRHHKTKQRENRWKRKTIWPLQGPTCLSLHCEVHLKQQEPIGPWVARKQIPSSAFYSLCHSEKTTAGRAWREGNSFVLVYLFLLISKNVSLIINKMFWNIHTLRDVPSCVYSITSRLEKVGRGSG